MNSINKYSIYICTVNIKNKQNETEIKQVPDIHPPTGEKTSRPACTVRRMWPAYWK